MDGWVWDYTGTLGGSVWFGLVWLYHMMDDVRWGDLIGWWVCRCRYRSYRIHRREGVRGRCRRKREVRLCELDTGTGTDWLADARWMCAEVGMDDHRWVFIGIGIGIGAGLVYKVRDSMEEGGRERGRDGWMDIFFGVKKRLCHVRLDDIHPSISPNQKPKNQTSKSGAETHPKKRRGSLLHFFSSLIRMWSGQITRFFRKFIFRNVVCSGCCVSGWVGGWVLSIEHR